MTYVTDPIGDLLTRMRNAQKVGRDSCVAPYSRIKKQLLDLLQKEGWIENVEIIGEAPKQELLVAFRADKASLNLRRVSKPGRRSYVCVADLKPVLNGFGMAVITTSKGLLTDKDAREKNIGGELLCTIS